MINCSHGVPLSECPDIAAHHAYPAPDDFGDLSVSFEDTISNEYLAEQLLQYICPAGEPWTGDTPWEDHGHTMCMWIGMAIKRLRATNASE